MKTIEQLENAGRELNWEIFERDPKFFEDKGISQICEAKELSVEFYEKFGEELLFSTFDFSERYATIVGVGFKCLRFDLVSITQIFWLVNSFVGLMLQATFDHTRFIKTHYVVLAVDEYYQ